MGLEPTLPEGNQILSPERPVLRGPKSVFGKGEGLG
jgi:hypothetical protein